MAMKIVVKGSSSHNVEWLYSRVNNAVKMSGVDANVELEKVKASGLGTSGTPEIYVDGIKRDYKDFETETIIAGMLKTLAA